jgi:AmpE protein
MKLLILLVVLALRRLEIDWSRSFTEPGRFAPLLALVSSAAASLNLAGGLRWALMVLLPAAVVAWLICLLEGLLWGLPAWIAGGALLLWLLGARSEVRLVDDMLVRGRMNDTEGLVALASEQFGVEGDPKDPAFVSDLSRQILFREAHHLFATIFWFALLGYFAAMAYVLNYCLLRLGDEEEKARDVAGVLHTALFWLPARLLVVCLALAGDWHRVMSACEGRLWQMADSETLLEDCLDAALGRSADNDGSLPAAVDRLEGLQGLLLRSLALWLLFAAGWVLIT